MATEEWVKRAIENSKTYEELPQRVRTLLPVAEWKAKYAILFRSLGNILDMTIINAHNSVITRLSLPSVG